MSVTRRVRVTAAAIMTATSPPAPVTSRCICRGSRGFPSKPPSLNGGKNNLEKIEGLPVQGELAPQGG